MMGASINSDARHPREGGDPFFLANQDCNIAMDSRLRGNDEFIKVLL
jgi:hypothetical protein